jgi:D-alanyl-D-alanine carboxypeptidase/D-alanyl-D-alanine-endopeptidase (penicillin-binding protein 4)
MRWPSRPAARAADAARASLLAASLMAAACAPAHPTLAPAAPGRRATALRVDLARLFGAPVFAHAFWAVRIESLRTGEVLFSLNPGIHVMPASNMKIVTLAAAAERLGWDYRFETKLVSAAPVTDGVLQGDLVVVGGGDPSLNERNGRAAAVFDAWAASLETAGIHAVAGALVADGRAFDREGLGAGWAWDDLAYGYAAPVGALEFDEGLARLTITPGAAPGDPAALALEPPESGLVVTNLVTTGAADERPSLDFRRLPGQARLEARGTVPAGAAPLVRSVSVDDPAAYFARAARAALAARGIEIRGGAATAAERPAAADAAAGGRVLALTQSPPLSDIATVLMKVSQNLYAETLLKALGRDGGPGTAERGIAAVRDVLAGWGLDPDGYVQVDGSGLSRYDYVTADLIVAILKHLYDDPRHRDPFLATLPIAGVDGTLAGRLEHTPAAGNARAKTGTLANVRALSGYVTTRDGEPLVFSIIANNFLVPASTVTQTADAAVARLAGFTRR